MPNDMGRQTVSTLRRELASAAAAAEACAHDPQRWRVANERVEQLSAQLGERIGSRQREAAAALPSGSEGGGFGTNWKPGQRSSQGWNGLGEQLLAVAHATRGAPTDNRLIRAPFGAGETDPSGGGFLVDTDFAATVLTRAYDMGEIAQRIMRIPISTNANGIKIPGVDETSRATGSRWGGVQAYWIGEGDTITTSKPKFRLIELDLKKLACAWTVTDELLADSVALTGIATQAFSEEITFMIENSAIAGNGVGMPLGIMNSPALVTVPKRNGQQAKTFLWENCIDMWSHMWMRSRFNAAWFVNQDVEPQLYSLRQTIGTGGTAISVSTTAPAEIYTPPGSEGRTYGTLLGRPVIPIEYASTLGGVGDVILADFSQYVAAEKKTMQAAASMHVRFLTDEMTFRLVYRFDGQPIWNTPLTPFQGSSSKSPFIVLAART